MMAAPRIDFDAALNEEQLAAVTHPEGPQLVIAGAGSGKTRVITYRIAWLVQERGFDPGDIAAVTFTNKAAAEMRERVEELLGLYPLPTFVGTFHRFALRLLRRWGDRLGLDRSFAIADSGDQLSLIKKALAQEGMDEKSFRPGAVLASISAAKNQLLDPRQYEAQADDFFKRRIAPAYRRYQRLLKQSNSIDFDDMIALSVLLLRQFPKLRDRLRQRTQALLVDEFQDTNHAQLSLIHELWQPGGDLTAVGDEDQGIYRWRGAELDNILNFEDSFSGTTVRKLQRNYRSTQNILDAAGSVVANNTQRRGKELWTDVGDGDQVLLYHSSDERDEARWVVNSLRALDGTYPLSDMAVLVRTNAQTRSLEEELLRQWMSYNLVGGVRFYERAEIKDLVAYLRLLSNPDNDLALSRVINRPTRGIGKTTQNALAKQADAQGVSQWQVIQGGTIDGVSARGLKAVGRFHQLVAGLREAADDLPLPNLMQRILDDTEYLNLFDRQDEDDQTRLENIDELVSAAQEFHEAHGYGSTEEDLLGAFLDHVALTADTDSLGRKQGVSLMTLHSAKGLEFSVVFLTGLEENILPHHNSQSLPEELEEERRLLYVGMTRAKKRLFLSQCQRRQIAGRYQDQQPSRFLQEIDTRCLEEERSPQLFQRGGGGYGGRQSSYGGGAYGSSSQPTSSRTAQDVYSFFGQSAPSGSAASPSSGGPSGGSSSGSGFFTPEPQAFPSYDEPDEAAGKTPRRGSRVRHAKLGIGRVLKVDGSGTDTRLVIYFEGKGRRTLVAKYAALEVMS